ncbi:hypothetical protein CYLTODRAFT_395283 [Cylindrobasidium torrendii FP15055 ss-10]|uniref:CFA20 domain-containing protein n=1 Tax=Cylindrobasidium torrendii FP15055 ss-10 TaxID=1314674 RepID=A0A0D7BEA1_9AGAR|nr:hypothetical protein CYLTODRAFT_395283 [Cylindrobasidium torrendii FP15055 ss-10]
MLRSSVQPPYISIFSSSGSNPLALYDVSVTKDDSSALVFIVNDADDADPGSTMLSLPDLHSGRLGKSIAQNVLHIQSPSLPSTYIQSRGHLGIRHPWVHIQVRNLLRDWSFELGFEDESRRSGVARLSTFQVAPVLIPDASLLHLPLAFPLSSPTLASGWATISVDLSSLIPSFVDASLVDRSDVDSDTEDEQGSSNLTWDAPRSFKELLYVKVYANCRIRRIWTSQTGSDAGLPWEFKLYAG